MRRGRRDPKWNSELADYLRFRAELEELYGDELDPFADHHHARCFNPTIPYHLISRVFQGRFLLRPNRLVRRVVAGVLGRCLKVHKTLTLYAYVFMSNHIHLREGKKPLGTKAILEMPLSTKRELPPQPWFEDRRRLIMWPDAKSEETKAYHDGYWRFQKAFRSASEKLRQGFLDAAFPQGAFRPGLLQPKPS